MQALVLSPTRELAAQTEKNILALGEFLKVQAHCCIGGKSLGTRVPPSPGSEHSTADHELVIRRPLAAHNPLPCDGASTSCLCNDWLEAATLLSGWRQNSVGLPACTTNTNLSIVDRAASSTLGLWLSAVRQSVCADCALPSCRRRHPEAGGWGAHCEWHPWPRV